MKACITGGCTKEGNLCRTCGLPCPSAKGRARVYCSAVCRNRRPPRRSVKPDFADCLVCGVSIPQDHRSRGKTRRICSPECKRRRLGRVKHPHMPCDACGKEIAQDMTSKGRARRTCSPECRLLATGTPRQCQRCGEIFLHFDKDKVFCSDRCRWPIQLTDSVDCHECHKPFIRRRHSQKYCSKSCVEIVNARSVAATVDRNKKRAQKFICLNCDKPYTAKNRSRRAFKFCSRECAFEARRLKKKCAERPREVVNKIASWFLSWGDDYWPLVYRCESCGGKMMQRNEDSPKPTSCVNCRPALRECVKCGSTGLGPFCRLCNTCARDGLKESRRRGKHRKRRMHGHESSFRARCRQHRAPYTPISKGLILERDAWACQLCGESLLYSHTIRDDGTVDPKSPSIDHVFPLSLGPDGPGHVSHNVIACCFACNSMKGDLNPEGWSCTLDSFAADYAPRLDFRAWLKAQHQLRSTSSNFAAQKKRSTGRNSAPRSTCCPSRRSGCDRPRKRCSAWSAYSRKTWGRSRSRTRR